ncbi:polysaccharide deacetylase family protein [Spirochaeta cellobiosiphila]|uniref:polysaccharide deacetylase family protein n=1 Tax=Spirochaeta cellobiosiphila TaxID=504483 RepID=UPI000408DF0C|nr:polysaccharide deacetylase family protein [Spirochaeta cellobiosiphila]
MNKKYCALTFDDGPDRDKTSLVLDILEREQIPASFFVIGQLINQTTQKTIERCLSLGCEIHNHSWGWDSLDRMTEEEIKQSITKTSEQIRQFAPEQTLFFRPPNLAISTLMSQTINLPFMGGIACNDWISTTSDEERVQMILNQVQDGSIILLHDVQPHQTHQSLNLLIQQLKEKNYHFVTLTQLFQQKSVDPYSRPGKLWINVNKEQA